MSMQRPPLIAPPSEFSTRNAPSVVMRTVYSPAIAGPPATEHRPAARRRPSCGHPVALQHLLDNELRRFGARLDTTVRIRRDPVADVPKILDWRLAGELGARDRALRRPLAPHHPDGEDPRPLVESLELVAEVGERLLDLGLLIELADRRLRHAVRDVK